MPTPVVKVVLIGGHGMMFGEGGLEKEMHMEKEKKVWDTEKLKNRDSIVFLLLLDIGQKIVWGLVSYKFLGICPVHHFLFCTIPQSFFKSNIGQIFLCCPVFYFLTNQTHP